MHFYDAWQAATEPFAETEDFRARMAMYRAMVEGCTNFPSGMNPFWGYASQLAWQLSSGRLETTTNAISPDSWWGRCNFALSVVPYIAAMEVGIVPVLPLAAPAHAAAMPLWREAFIVMQTSRDLDAIRVALWRAHRVAITLAARLFRREHALLPRGEQRFTLGWIRMVDLFSAAAIRTDLEKLFEVGTITLPPRILRADDDYADFTKHQRSVSRYVSSLADPPEWQWILGLATWRRMMRTAPARADAEYLAAAILGRGTQVWTKRLQAARYLI